MIRIPDDLFRRLTKKEQDALRGHFKEIAKDLRLLCEHFRDWPTPPSGPTP